MAPSSSSSSSSSSSFSSTRHPLFASTPLPPRRPSRAFPSSAYVALAVQVVHFNPISRIPMAARITIVDYRGHIIYDTFIRPTQPVYDYRTSATGLHPFHLAGAPEFSLVQAHVSSIIHGKIIIGHALWHSLSVMGLSHPAIDTRDTALFLSFRKSLKYKPSDLIPLSTLMQRLMGRQIGLNGEIAVEQARAALDLFRSCEQVWEGVIKSGAWPFEQPRLQ